MNAPEKMLQETVELLKAMLAIPSLSRQEDKIASFLFERLSGWHPGRVRRSGHNLIVDIPGAAGGPTLLLCSHFDTVSPNPGWTRDPYAATVEGDKIYGLGANDAGASVVGMIAASRMIGMPARGRLLLCLAAEEESGDQGFIKVEPELPRYDAAIFGEPTDMGVATEMRGSMKAILRSRGVSCHASRPWEGKNATDQFAKDLAVLRAIDLKDKSVWGCTTIEPTVIRGGDSTNQIPALIETTLDIRTTPDKNNDWVIGQFRKSGLEIDVTMNRRRPMHNNPDAPLIKAIKRANPAMKNYVFNGSCDMAFSTAPSVVMGPGKSTRSHAADEYITVPELSEAIALYHAIAAEYLK